MTLNTLKLIQTVPILPSQLLLWNMIKPEKKAEFDMRLYSSCHKQIHPNPFWLLRQCCAKHKAFDKCLPGVFKLELEGVVMVALCSKTDILRDGW